MRTSAAVALLLMLVALPAASQTGASIHIINNDPPGEGFNDPTPAQPVGGNEGTTVGQQRLIAFQHAANIWASEIESSIPIRVEAYFSPLACSSTAAILGSAGAGSVYRDFPNAPLRDTWFVSALASKLAGEDLDEGNPAITARFNSDLGKPDCGTRGWYYGLDNNGGPDRIDLVVVVLHELGHGLGFVTITDKRTGEFIGRTPDVYSTFLFDNEIGVTWPLMSDEQRAESATRTDGLTWVGPNAVSAAPGFLGPAPRFEIISPESARRTYMVGSANFGGPITVAGLSGTIVAARDAANLAGPTTTDACTALLNAPDLAGKIALIDRGGCDFIVKARNVQNAGAVAAIIANTAESVLHGMSGVDPSIVIPVIGISKADGAAIRSQLPAGLEATIRQDPQRLAGADDFRRPLIYAPQTLAAGSSVSHWDVSAEPDLLMEPSISDGLGHGVDLTRALFADLGWHSEASVAPGLRHIILTDRDEDGEIDPGDSVRLIATIRNDSDVAGNSVVFDCVIPDGATVIPGSVAGGIAESERERVIVRLGTLAARGQATVTFDILIDPALPSGITSIPVQGTVSATNLPSSTTEATVIIVSHTPLRAFKAVEMARDADESGNLTSGDVLRYHIRITNHSTRAVSDVRFEDRIDALTTFAAGDFEAVNGVIRAELGVIQPGAFVEFSYDVTVNAGMPHGRSIVNQAEITAAGIGALVTDDPATAALSDPTVFRSGGSRRRSVAQ